MAPPSAAGVNGDGGGGIPLSLSLPRFFPSCFRNRRVPCHSPQRTDAPPRASAPQASLFCASLIEQAGLNMDSSPEKDLKFRKNRSGNGIMVSAHLALWSLHATRWQLRFNFVCSPARAWVSSVFVLVSAHHVTTDTDARINVGNADKGETMSLTRRGMAASAAGNNGQGMGTSLSHGQRRTTGLIYMRARFQ